MSRTPLRIATRGSALARWQANAVAEALARLGIPTTTEIMTTTGDRSQHGRVPGDDSKRQFVKELEDALLDNRADLAVHSAKDLPVILPEGLGIAACLPREDPRDAIVLRTPASISAADAFAGLRDGAIVGTGSVRRSAQLRGLTPRSVFAPIRGNVDTRLAKLDAGECDALVLACAGLRRLGLGFRISAAIPLDECVPAPGQGIVAVEIRGDDRTTADAIRAIHDERAGRALAAERAVVVALGGGCQLPLGAIAEERDTDLTLLAVVASADGARILRHTMRGTRTEPESLGRHVADALAADGARALLGEVELR